MAIKIDKLTIYRIKEQGFYIFREQTKEDEPEKNELTDEAISMDNDMLLLSIKNWIDNKEL